MKVSARRFGASVLAVVAAATMCIGCSSESNGTPVFGSTPAASTTGSATGATFPTSSSNSSAGAPVLVPSSGTTSAAPGGSGGSATKFCADFTSGGLDIQPTNGLDGPVKVWQKLAADAPPEIKSDAEKVRDFLQAIAAGHSDPSLTAGISTAVQRVTSYAVKHCTGD